jgi:hypothetical protein
MVGYYVHTHISQMLLPSNVHIEITIYLLRAGMLAS